jgi:hypothetical protein
MDGIKEEEGGEENKEGGVVEVWKKEVIRKIGRLFRGRDVGLEEGCRKYRDRYKSG